MQLQIQQDSCVPRVFLHSNQHTALNLVHTGINNLLYDLLTMRDSQSVIDGQQGCGSHI
jgi:hypothetical protein